MTAAHSSSDACCYVVDITPDVERAAAALVDATRRAARSSELITARVAYYAARARATRVVDCTH